MTAVRFPFGSALSSRSCVVATLTWLLPVLLPAAESSASVGRAERRPLIRDFVGLNAYAQGHSPHAAFDPDLYRPTAGLLREYHRVSRDLQDDPAVLPAFPRAKDGFDWSVVYQAWTARGWKIDACLQFESVAREKWKDVDAEARAYGQAYAKTFGHSGARKLVESVEIGNEPTKWSDADFSRMFRAMAQGIREGDPRMRIVTSNVTAGPSGTWDKSVACIAAFPELFDVLALHVYAELEQDPVWRRSYPENPKLLRYLNDITALCDWRDRHAPDKAVWVTEFGYDSSTKSADPNGKMPHWVGVTDEQQAQWLVRSILMFASMEVERAYIYFFNDRDQPSLHAAAGITRHFQPKPSFHALAHLQRVLGACRFQRPVADEPGRVRVQEFVHSEQPDTLVWAVWSPTGEQLVSRQTFRRPPGRLVRAERMPLSASGAETAATFAVQHADGNVEVEVTESPVYLVFDALPSG